VREGEGEGMGVLTGRNDGAARRLRQRRWQCEVAGGVHSCGTRELSFRSSDGGRNGIATQLVDQKTAATDGDGTRRCPEVRRLTGCFGTRGVGEAREWPARRGSRLLGCWSGW
jgi:hypothetical protein